jgi:hypothetical protein
MNHLICSQQDIPKRARQICDGKAGNLSEEKQLELLNYFAGIETPRKELPGLLERAATFVGAVADYALAGFPAMPEGESERRLNTCRACPEFVPESSQCRQCGCYMNLKTQLATSACPLGLWVAVPSKKAERPASEDTSPSTS